MRSRGRPGNARAAGSYGGLSGERHDTAASIAESHSAVVAFIGDRAYKVKKPVNLGFLDYTTVAAREVACRRELNLNRRLAPDVYLDLWEVQDSRGRTRDWVVVMRRMPADRRLSTLVRQGEDVETDLRTLARLLAAFHAGAETGPAVAAAGLPGALRKRWSANLNESAPFAGSVLDKEQFDEIGALALSYVDGRAHLLDERASAGYVVDGHGDLLADDIFCLPDGPRVLDCLEFDDALRNVDGIDDAAFLAMDLERLGAADLAQRFLGWYGEFSGTVAPPSLVHHYIAYRAFVRAKVACLRYRQGVPEERANARQLAGMAWQHLRTARVRLVLVGGLPGTGKSTVAAGLADQLGATLLRSDEIRREVPGAAALDPHAGYGRGLYERKHVHATYRQLLARARTLVEHGETVIVDATWSDPDERRAARTLGRETSTTLVELRCVAPAEVTRPRIASRVGDASDATTEIAGQLEQNFADWPESLPIDTARSADDAVAAAWGILKE
ncbi:AAA family ATPase [Actinopolymorpha sp. B11F2]|uniref:bifunctional aminoglycoside phosphotransferase/ATP-binding protein n=1 Tax=Actinopolymorpha sp. B11F2 TaxID=3160862 RepID=UPI0032E401B5